MERVRAIVSHDIPNRSPITVRPGDEVTVGERDTTWPAFVFVTADQGDGWVPSRHLDGETGRATVVTEYDTTELPTEVGELLVVLRRDDESGWIWCRNGAGAEGWVPINTVSDIDES